jgi:hypothetical protein
MVLHTDNSQYCNKNRENTELYLSYKNAKNYYLISVPKKMMIKSATNPFTIIAEI